MRVTSMEMHGLSELVRELCGIELEDGKEYLVEARLSSLAEQHGCVSFRDLIELVRSRRSRALQAQIIDAIATNETYFFREPSAFDTLTSIALPELLASKRGTSRDHT